MIDSLRPGLAALLLSACSLPVVPEELPAVIDVPSSASSAALEQAISASLNGAPVTVADDALTRESVLVIERKPLRDANGVRVSGRELGRPERFRLLLVGGECVLVHERTGTRATLQATRCRAL